MGEIASCSIAIVAVALTPTVAQRFGFAIAVITFLSFPFTFPFPALAQCPVLLPEPFRSIFVNLQLDALWLRSGSRSLAQRQVGCAHP